MANSALGNVNVNFDAETEREALCIDDYGKVYDFGLSWSETYQASAREDGKSSIQEAPEIINTLKDFGSRLSANLVLGNAAYGFKPEFKSLVELATRLGGISPRQMKVGAEGKRNGRRAMQLASKTGSMAYILRTDALCDLLDYANLHRLDSTVYSLCRISSEGRSRASSDLMRIKGNSYFVRRGISTEDISSKLNDFAVFGTAEQVAFQVRNLIDGKGAQKMALYPVFENYDDLLDQMKMLSLVVTDS